ncbi:MAG: sugar nucleotide-binding protein [Saprospiraceae bacterium]|nr:sugar nucleotide-binding protein [Saprospiraceae bacterium]
MAVDFLILGSTGMLGQALMNTLKAENHSVIGLARKNADICIDITDDALLLQTLKAIAPQVIINTVAIVNLSFCEQNPDQSYVYNARVSSVLANYCASESIKYVYISTDHYFSKNKNFKHSENAQVNLCNEYARTKYIGEQLSLTNPNALVIRTNIVGFRYNPDTPTFVEWVINALEKQEKMILFDDFYTSSLDVYSFSKALCILIKKDASGLYNLASSEVSNKNQFISKLAQKLGFSLNNTSIGSMEQSLSEVQRNNSLGLDVSKAEKLLNFNLPKLSDVINNLATEYLNRKKIS